MLGWVVDSFFRLVEVLEGLPPETSADFERRLGGVNASVDLLRLVAGDRDLPEDVAFAGFCRLVTVLRRNGDLRGFEEALACFGGSYGHRPMFSHHRAIWLGISTGRADLGEALRLARRNLEVLVGCPGVAHLFAETVAKVGELYAGDVTGDDLRLGLRAVGGAIGADPSYGKYYATRGRLRGLGGDWEQAYEDVSTAIRLEPEEPTGAYVMRIVRYEMILLRLSLQRTHQTSQPRVGS